MRLIFIEHPLFPNETRSRSNRLIANRAGVLSNFLAMSVWVCTSDVQVHMATCVVMQRDTSVIEAIARTE